MIMENKPSILLETRDSIKTFLLEAGEPGFRSEQVCDWLFTKRRFDLDGWTNISKKIKERLAEHFAFDFPHVIEKLDSIDGSTKLLLGNGKHVFEAVILRYNNRVSLCVSSQVGCRLACRFCQTGKLGFVRHLSAAEILGQFALAQNIIKNEERKISHVVFMGMGEPFDNYDNVIKTANQMINGFGMNPKNVTLSTSGLAPRIESLASDSRAALALSLHACRDDLRNELMPINTRYNLAKLKEALLSYQKETGRLITLEYILIRDKNCGIREAKELVRFIHGLRVKVNLIPFNAHPGMPYQRPSDEVIREFQKYLSDRSIPAPVRYSKGLDVSAACGQLAAKSAPSLAQPPVRANLMN